MGRSVVEFIAVTLVNALYHCAWLWAEFSVSTLACVALSIMSVSLFDQFVGLCRELGSDGLLPPNFQVYALLACLPFGMRISNISAIRSACLVEFLLEELGNKW